MPLITSATMKTLVDRMAGQYKLLNNAVIALNDLGPDTYFNIITAVDDRDVELPTLTQADLADTSITSAFVTKQSFPPLFRLINSILGNFNRVSYFGGYDQFFVDNDFRASDYFNQLYVAATGTFLLAKNVFCEVDSTFATLTVNPGPVLLFTDGVNFGNGAIPNRYAANNGNFAATQLAIKVISMGAAPIDFHVIGTDKDNNLISNNVSVPGSLSPGTYVPIGSASTRYLDVGSVNFPNLNNGTNGDVYEIHNIFERTI